MTKTPVKFVPQKIDPIAISPVRTKHKRIIPEMNRLTTIIKPVKQYHLQSLGKYRGKEKYRGREKGKPWIKNLVYKIIYPQTLFTSLS